MSQIAIPEGSSYVRDWAGWENSTNPGYLPFEGSPAGTLGKVNILWYQSLRASAFLARELEKNMTLAHDYDELADKVHESVNNVLYDKEKHYYYISTDRKTGIAQDLNAMAILYGVAPIADRQAILDTMDVALIDESKPGKYLAYSYDAYGYPHKAVPYSAVSAHHILDPWFKADRRPHTHFSTTMPLLLSRSATPASEWTSSTVFGLL